MVDSMLANQSLAIEPEQLSNVGCALLLEGSKVAPWSLLACHNSAPRPLGP